VIGMRVRVVAGAACVLAVGAGIGGVALSRGSGEAATAAETPGATAEVVRTDLVGRTDVDGTLGYADSYTITTSRGGRLTWLPDVGDVIRRGKRVYEVDGRPVPLFHGDTPLWRRLYLGVSDGKDVRVLERNLKALGYGDDMTVDTSFTWATAKAVKEWQEDLGVDETGRVSPEDVVVQPGDLRVAALRAALGGVARGEVLTATGTTRQVVVNLPVTQQELARIGDQVRVRLPGGNTTTGKITEIGTTASAGSRSGSGQAQTGEGTETATIPVYVTLTDPSAAGRLDGAPVTVGFTSATRKGVLAVPVTALLAEADGSYVVKVVDGERTRRVPVEVGSFADGLVEVSGAGLEAGMRVEVPGS
jgi:Membrane-fusion protein